MCNCALCLVCAAATDNARRTQLQTRSVTQRCKSKAADADACETGPAEDIFSTIKLLHPVCAVSAEQNSYQPTNNRCIYDLCEKHRQSTKNILKLGRKISYCQSTTFKFRLSDLLLVSQRTICLSFTADPQQVMRKPYFASASQIFLQRNQQVLGRLGA
jgi:hypothetical protein